jgi:hypothetical protein
MACHIAAAGTKGSARRVVPGATPKQLSDISNGIWMCYTHGKQIDADEVTFSIAMLKIWRDLAESKAKLRHELGQETTLWRGNTATFRLPDDEISLPGLGTENQTIGDALHFSCLSDIWGVEVADAVRDACIEIVRNAFTHGAARASKLLISSSSVTVEDDGAAFNSGELRYSPNGGGGNSLRIIAEKFSSTVIFQSKRVNSKNLSTFALVRKAEDLAKFSPCTVTVTFNELHRGQISAHVIQDCDITYFVLPSYFAFSDVLKLPRLLANALPSGVESRAVLVTTRLSAGVLELLRKHVPNVEIINFGDGAES